MARPSIPKQQKIREGAELRLAIERAQELEEGLTQEGLAEEMGISQGALNHYLRGSNPIPDKRLVWLGKRLGFDPRQIRSSLSDYYSSDPQTDDERRLLLAYRSDPGLKRAIDAIAEMSPAYHPERKQQDD